MAYMQKLSFGFDCNVSLVLSMCWRTILLLKAELEK